MQLKRHEVTQWVTHPVTQKMLEIVREYKEANKKDLNDRLLYGSSLAQQDLHQLSQLKGQILAFETMEEIKEFILDALEFEEANKEVKEVNEDEVQSDGAKGSFESKEVR